MLTKFFSTALTLLIGTQASQITKKGKEVNTLLACDCPDDDGPNNCDGDCFASLLHLSSEHKVDKCVPTDSVDEFDDGCPEYRNNPEWCGCYDTEEFNSLTDCCDVCAGVTECEIEEDDVDQPDLDLEWYSDCENSNHGALDEYGDSCVWYDYDQTSCGYYDTEEFDAEDMCCACQA